MIGVVYSLREEVQSAAFYIGLVVSVKDLSVTKLLTKRLVSHISASCGGRLPVNFKVNSLLQRGIRPKIAPVEIWDRAQISSSEELLKEKYWIKLFLDYGHSLVNVRHGAGHIRNGYRPDPLDRACAQYLIAQDSSRFEELEKYL